MHRNRSGTIDRATRWRSSSAVRYGHRRSRSTARRCYGRLPPRLDQWRSGRRFPEPGESVPWTSANGTSAWSRRCRRNAGPSFSGAAGRSATRAHISQHDRGRGCSHRGGADESEHRHTQALRQPMRCGLTNCASAARALAAAAAPPRSQYKARRLPRIERALVCCMRWLGNPFLGSLLVREENRFQGLPEQLANCECEGEGRIIPPRFNRVYSLARNPQFRCELRLRPGALAPEDP